MITRLSLSGTPGKNYSFSAKTPAVGDGDGYMIGTLSMQAAMKGALSLQPAMKGTFKLEPQ